MVEGAFLELDWIKNVYCFIPGFAIFQNFNAIHSDFSHVGDGWFGADAEETMARAGNRIIISFECNY